MLLGAWALHFGAARHAVSPPMKDRYIRLPVTLRMVRSRVGAINAKKWNGVEKMEMMGDDLSTQRVLSDHSYQLLYIPDLVRDIHGLTVVE